MDNGYIERVDSVERHIIDQVIKDVLATGHLIDVADGNSFLGKPSNVPHDIQSLIGHTDTTVLTFETGEGVIIGHVVFLHGKGADVIEDHSNEEFTENVLRNAKAIAVALLTGC